MAVKKPTGLSIARKGNVLTLSWKAGETYDKSQEFGYKTSRMSKWSSSATLQKSVRKHIYKITLSSYYPATKKTLSSVKLRVRGKKGKSWSAWNDKGFKISVPDAPKLTCSPDSVNTNVCVFSWDVATKDTDNRIFNDVEYQSMLVPNCSVADGSKLTWKDDNNDWREGTVASDSSSRTITEDTSDIANGSHTRWFRARSRGPAGASAWRYSKRVYAAPFQAVITEATATENVAGGYQIYVAWNNTSNAANPTDTMVVQYTKAVPEAGLACPGDASWTDLDQAVRVDSTNAISASVDGALSEDQCLFVRINTVHLDKTVYGVPAAALIGNLKAPEITNVETVDATHRATITTNNRSDVEDSFLVVLYRTVSDPGNALVVGIVPHGSTSTTVQCPDWTDETYAFGVYAAVGSYEEIERSDNVSSYAVDYSMRSLGEVWSGGEVPKAPKNVSATATSIPGTIRVTWDTPWDEATAAILSWADHEDAWQSTDEPNEYTVSNINASEWNISGLETGVRWYVRVRLVKGSGDNMTYGPWSKPCTIDLSSAPVIPTLTLSSNVVSVLDDITAYWTYVSTDGTKQVYAEICEAEVDGEGITYGDIIASTETAQHLSIVPGDVGWSEGETHYLCVRVVSGSGRTSDDWSDPVPVIIAEKLTAEIYSTSLTTEIITVDGESRTVNALTDMPLSVTVHGAGTGGTTILVIERAEDYHVDRPDETDFNGFEGETIAVITETGEDPITIDMTDLLGPLDDSARYNLIATVKDGLGQSDTDSLEFEVHWSHQAVIPEAEVHMEKGAACITPIMPEGAISGDTCDIYRLSADAPELIYEGAQFGTTYVDPYPTIGEFGGHRVVFKTSCNDYITESDDLAWIDLTKEDGDFLDVNYSIIDFDGEQVIVLYDSTEQDTWEKNFKETIYLGGSVQGDWNKGVSHKAAVGLSKITVKDHDSIKAMRRLAVYTGSCHLRTLDGASFTCDIQVVDNKDYSKDDKKVEYSLSVTRVDPEEPDGVTYDSWSE